MLIPLYWYLFSIRLCKKILDISCSTLYFTMMNRLIASWYYSIFYLCIDKKQNGYVSSVTAIGMENGICEPSSNLSLVYWVHFCTNPFLLPTPSKLWVKYQSRVGFLVLSGNQSKRRTTLNSKLRSCQWETILLYFPEAMAIHR